MTAQGPSEYQEVVDAEGNVVGRVPLQFGETGTLPTREFPDAQPGQPIRSGVKARARSDQAGRPAFYLWFLFHVAESIILAIALVVTVVSLLRIGGLM